MAGCQREIDGGSADIDTTGKIGNRRNLSEVQFVLSINHLKENLLDWRWRHVIARIEGSKGTDFQRGLMIEKSK
ncbi:MAG: hypothetical protein ACJAZW_002432 [Maritalea sp.]